jgi:hypothetical protein
MGGWASCDNRKGKLRRNTYYLFAAMTMTSAQRIELLLPHRPC